MSVFVLVVELEALVSDTWLVLASELVLAWDEGVDLVVDEQATKRLRLATVARESVNIFKWHNVSFLSGAKGRKTAELFYLYYIK